MKILHVCSELTPFAKTGGLADVTAGLSKAQVQISGVQAAVILPRYGSIDPGVFQLKKYASSVSIVLGTEEYHVEFFQGSLPEEPGVSVYFVEHPLFSEKTGIYGPKEDPTKEYPNNAVRFGLLCKAALALAKTFEIPVDVLHSHDWQAALACYFAAHDNGYKKSHHRPARIFTIHNLAFQGIYPLHSLQEIGIVSNDLTTQGLEFYGHASLLKAGLLWADQITTVSHQYSREIQTAEFGWGLQGLLQNLSIKMTGILNGIDEDVWSPETDIYIPRQYHINDAISGKAACKIALQQELGLLPRPRAPLCATISRLTEQKGIELILQVLENEQGFDNDLQYVVLGQGDPSLQQRLLACANRHPGRMAVQLGYDEVLAHRIEAAADVYVMPSKFEPCGLNQMYSLRYGVVPVVHAVGGLVDTVENYDPIRQTGTGFVFYEFNAQAFSEAWRRALTTYHRDPVAFQGLIRRGMARDFSWTRSAKEYVAVYQRAILGKLG